MFNPTSRLASLAGLLLIAGSLTAQVPMLAPAAVPSQGRLAKAPTGELLKEDFSRFTAGSENAPDATNIADLRTGVIDAKYTSAPGWTGAAIYQAGGICAITTGKYQGSDGIYEDTGFLSSPVGDYAGDLSVTFRARLLESSADADVMAIILGSTTAGRLEAQTVNITPAWKDYTVTFSKGQFQNCLIQWTMLKEKVLIDDICVKSVQTSIPAPVALAASDFTDKGFTAHWKPTDEAESYLLTVYERDIKSATTVVDFESINLDADGKHINAANPGFPQGWTFAYAAGTADHVWPGMGADGSRGIVFDAQGEGFVTPMYTEPIRDFFFYARHPSGHECFSKFKVSVLVNNQWQGLGNLDVERISKDGETVNFSTRLPDGVQQIQVMFDYNANNDAAKDVRVVVDNITVMTEPAAKAIITDRAEQGTQAVVTGLEPDNDYSYTVKARNAGFTSAESNNMMAVGLASPELGQPEEVSATSYTARWKAAPKAQGYVVSNYRVHTMPADGIAVILDEDFSKVTEGTLEKPVGLYNTANATSLDEYTKSPGWLGKGNYLVEGMLGARSYFTVQGAIQTPALDLSANEGKFKVELTIVADSDAKEDMIVVQAGAANYLRKAIPDVMVPVKVEFEFDCGEAAMPLLLYTYQGMPFYIDDIRVTQQVEKGKQTFTEIENKTVQGRDATSTSFSVPAAGENENYAYRVVAYRNFYGTNIVSASPQAMHVLSTTGIATVEGAAGITVYADGLTLHISAAQPEEISVYGVNGAKVASISVPEGNSTVNLPAAGLYLVAGSKGTVAKVLAR